MKKHIHIALFIIITIIIIWHFKHMYIIRNSPSTKYIRIGTTADYPPFCFIQNNTIVGFDIDIVSEVCKRLNTAPDIIDMPFSQLIPSLYKNKTDIVAAGISPDPRRNHTLFTQAYFQGDPLVIVTLKPLKIKNIKELYNKNVVVNKGYLADLYISKISGIKIQRAVSASDAIEILKNKKAVALISAQSNINSLNKSKTFNTTIIPNIYEEYSLAISHKQPKLHQKIQKILDNMKQDGSIESLKIKWRL